MLKQHQINIDFWEKMRRAGKLIEDKDTQGIKEKAAKYETSLVLQSQ